MGTSHTHKSPSDEQTPSVQTDGNSQAAEPIIVGIGASAGGLDALRKALPGLPDDVGMSYIIVQHLAPKYKSTLPALLEKYSQMPVKAIFDGLEVRPDTIYVAPPDRHVVYEKGTLRFREGTTMGPKPSIDMFLKSLAAEKMIRCVGIVLSGTGSDGTLGIRAVKSNDGITMAQTPESAKFSGMPQSAIDTGLVDLVLPPEKLGDGLQTAMKYPHLLVKLPVETNLDGISDILEIIHDNMGVDYRNYKKSTVHRRISRRMAIHSMEQVAAYADFLRGHPEEVALLAKDMLISVTGFFRDANAFKSLAGHLSKLFKAKKTGDAVRVWVPACSTGEEAYSIAMLIADMMGEKLGKYRFQIFATDIDTASIQTARKGTFPVAAVDEADEQYIRNYFIPMDNHHLTIKKEIRDMVILAPHDIIKDTGFMHMDLISCRNLLIYLNAEQQGKLLSLFHFSLNPNGLLFLGKSENIGKQTDLFRTVDPKWKIFQRKETGKRKFPEVMMDRRMPRVQAQNPAPSQTDSCTFGEGEFFDSLLGLMDCCAVLTDDQGNIHYIRGDVNAYFRLPEGNVKNNLNAVEMARPELRFVLQSLIYRAGREEQTVTSNTVNIHGSQRAVRVKIGPVDKDVADGQRLIVFTPVEPNLAGTTGAGTKGAEADPDRVKALEEDLAFTRKHLQDTIEELEVSTEELQSMNEELQAANEELQATNEELETSNEELQASNEELHTVNDELRAKSEEAAKLLHNLTESEQRYRRLVENMNEAIMLCEIEHGAKGNPVDLFIHQANRSFEMLMQIKRRELPMRAGAAGLHELVANHLLADFLDIAENGGARNFELHVKAIEKDLTLSVYRVRENRLGVVCRDDTEQKRFSAALAQSEKKYRALIETANSIIIRWDTHGEIRFINDFGLRFFGYKAGELIGKDVMTIVPEKEKSTGRDLAGLVKDIPVHPENYTFVPSENITKNGQTVWVAWTNKAMLDENDNVTEILAIGNDITALKEAEMALAKSRK